MRQDQTRGRCPRRRQERCRPRETVRGTVGLSGMAWRSVAAQFVAVGAFALLVTACSGGSGTPGASGSPGASGNSTAGALAYSQCMREHGITNFPDPSSGGGIGIGASSGINVNSSQYLAAAKACQPVQGGQQSQAQQDENYNAALRYARCMQSRGVDVPDPAAPGSGGPVSQSNSSPGTGGSGGSGPNPDSPQYIAANKACEHYLPTGQGPSLSGNGGGS
jgi:hypothetical protein